MTCGTNRCCDAHMNSETKEGKFILNGAKVPKVSNSIKMIEYAEVNKYQQWTIVPAEEEAPTAAKQSLARLKMGDLCIALDQLTSKTMLLMDDCNEGIVFNFQSFEEN